MKSEEAINLNQTVKAESAAFFTFIFSFFLLPWQAHSTLRSTEIIDWIQDETAPGRLWFLLERAGYLSNSFASLVATIWMLDREDGLKIFYWTRDGFLLPKFYTETTALCKALSNQCRCKCKLCHRNLNRCIPKTPPWSSNMQFYSSLKSKSANQKFNSNCFVSSGLFFFVCFCLL